MNAMPDFLSLLRGQKQREATGKGHVVEIHLCECGCGLRFPASQMVKIPTQYPEHPTEYVFEMHYNAINDVEEESE
jgi:hypothetical protein